MNNSPNIKQVETVLKYIKNELYFGRLQPGERLPAERRLADMLGVGRSPYLHRGCNHISDIGHVDFGRGLINYIINKERSTC